MTVSTEAMMSDAGKVAKRPMSPRRKRYFIALGLAGLFGGACGGAYVVAAKVGMTAVGLTGIPGMAIVQPMSLIHYVIGLVIAFGAAFAASYLLKYKVE